MLPPSTALECGSSITRGRKEKIDEWDLFDTAELEACKFITDSVEDEWLAELKQKITIYAERTILELTEHLYILVHPRYFKTPQGN